MSYRFLSSIIVVVFLLSACTAQAQVEEPKQKATINPGTALQGYPVPDEMNTGTGDYPTQERMKIYEPGELPPSPASAPEPQSGKAAISGTIFSFTGQVTIPDTVFYLVPAVDGSKVPGLLIGPDTTKGDIVGRTDASGSFSMDDIPPGNYYMAVWAPYTWVIAVDPSKNPPLEQMISLQADQKEMLGVIQVSWP